MTMQALDRRAFIGRAIGPRRCYDAAARAATSATIRVGSVPVEAYMQPYYGNAAHLYQDAGIDLQVTGLANSGAIIAALLGGSLDAGIGSPTGIAQARLRGVPLKIFAPGGMYSVDRARSLIAHGREKFADYQGERHARQNHRNRSSQERAANRDDSLARKKRRGSASVRWWKCRSLGCKRHSNAAKSMRRDDRTRALVSQGTCRELVDYNAAIAPQLLHFGLVRDRRLAERERQARAYTREGSRSDVGVDVPSSGRVARHPRAVLESPTRHPRPP